MKANKDPNKKYSTMPQTPEEMKAFKEMMRKKKNEITSPVGGEAQRTKYEERFMKLKNKFKDGGKMVDPPKPKYAKAEDYYMGEGQPFLAQALNERNVSGRKGTGEDVKTMWEGVKKSNPKLANELLQRAKQFRMESGGEYSIKTSKAPGFGY